MTVTQELSIVTELINEVESYLPEMRGFLRVLVGDYVGPHEHALTELHRMAHTIKGAAAMVELDDLSSSAALMEDALDRLPAGKQTLDSRLIEVMDDSLDHFGAYCQALHEGKADGAELYREIRELFETLAHRFSVPATKPDLSVPEEMCLDFSSDGEGDEFTDDFLHQLSDEEEATLSGDVLETLLGGSDSDSRGFVSEVVTEKPDSRTMAGIDPELQECFNEEVADHLEDLAGQLNVLSTAITGLTAISDDYRDILHSIRRSVHTMKGAAAVIGVDPVAEWGHDFEDFLDWLHDESESLSPEIISVMMEGSDLLAKIAAHPDMGFEGEISTIQAHFLRIITAFLPERQKTEAANLEEEPGSLGEDQKREQVFHEKVNKEPRKDSVSSLRINGPADVRKQIREKNTTLRVGSKKIARLMGLSGDMVINLSSFEDATVSMHSGLMELEMTLQRLKDIASSLENDHEPATIPHLGASQSQCGMTAEFDTLEMDRYSELHVLLGSLNEAVVDFNSIREQTQAVHNSWRLAVDRQRSIVSEVQGAVQSIQMTPFSTLSNRLYKTVRESARVTGKKVRLIIEGASMEMDTHIWDLLADALMHMLRNSVDHGVETVDERKHSGKPEQATIRINCSRRGNRFVLRLSDDGAGLNYDAMKSRALTLYPELDVAGMDNKALAALIFKQGFSVRAEITAMSGRGVGMDVVRNALDQLDGSIEVFSNPGLGTDFVLSMPIVVAQLSVLIVTFGPQQFAVPMHDISKVLKVTDNEMKKDTFLLDNKILPLLRPVELFRLKYSGDSSESRSGVQKSTLALVVESCGKCGVLVVDTVIGQRDVVFKSLGSHLQNVACIAGATILGDGSLVPILQTEDLFGRIATDVQIVDNLDAVCHDREKTFEVLIVDDSIGIRKVLSNVIRSQGWHPTAAHDGVHAMEKIRDVKPDFVILDIEMPRMNGFEVLHTLQAQPAYRDIPVLMLTSRSAGKYRDKAAELGARGFVTKPFRNDELITFINNFTGKKTTQGHRDS